MGALKDRANELSPYIRLADGESITGIYRDWKEVANNFDPTKSVFQYELEVDGQTKYFKSGNATIAFFFDDAESGTVIKITRKGIDRETRYTVEEVKE